MSTKKPRILFYKEVREKDACIFFRSDAVKGVKYPDACIGMSASIASSSHTLGLDPEYLIDYIFKVSSFDKLNDFADAFDELAGLAAENPKMTPRDENMAFPDIRNITLPHPYNNYIMYWVIRIFLYSTFIMSNKKNQRTQNSCSASMHDLTAGIQGGSS